MISSVAKQTLAAAGLLVEGEGEQSEGLIPASVAAQAASCTPSDHRTDIIFDLNDPQLIQQANASWYQLSSEAGLFSEGNGLFLLGLPLEEEGASAWVPVRLGESWDIVGKGAATLLGSGPGRPEFIALSGRVSNFLWHNVAIFHQRIRC